MIVVIAPIAWLLVVVLALALCRLSARSDDTDVRALRRWVRGEYVTRLRTCDEAEQASPSPWEERRAARRVVG